MVGETAGVSADVRHRHTCAVKTTASFTSECPREVMQTHFMKLNHGVCIF